MLRTSCQLLTSLLISGGGFEKRVFYYRTVFNTSDEQETKTLTHNCLSVQKHTFLPLSQCLSFSLLFGDRQSHLGQLFVASRLVGLYVCGRECSCARDGVGCICAYVCACMYRRKSTQGAKKAMGISISYRALFAPL